MLAPVIGQTHGHLPYAAAAGSVGRQARVSRNARHRSDVNDPPIATLNHASGNRLRREKCSPQVGIENQIPVIPGDIERWFTHVAAGVVHQNINLSEGLLRRCRHLLNALPTAHIEFERDRPTAERLDLGLEPAQAARMAAGQHQIRPRRR